MQRLFRAALSAALVIVMTLALSGLALAQGNPAATPQPGKTLVKIETTKGDIVLQLFKDKAPQSVGSFLKYAKSGHYDGTIFHRVINSFMIQGGGFDIMMQEKPTGAPIRNEADNGLKNSLYTIAMARTSDPHSASAQFYINVKDNRSLDFRSKTEEGWGYAVFGVVVDGKRVVDEIKGVATGSRGPYDDVPLKPILIKKVVVLSE
ncbi:MAG: peptidylprolyl isomerase [Humidesulfovibrio sp.]|uniref:peptidylprolyl isomerase n=1 Tax=Humidesulfovibrio sp. TaxID=2910988 RepID=UPI0027FC3DA3|nr:peptidylprolyl isomerase [Humidesulfovibrio sp.]MDQ7834895.1 peptidylprolyl isomerase [Humidesulfovibrio sp.]